MLKQNKNGFAFPTLMFVTIITFTVAAVGWYVYTKQYNVIDSRGVAGVIKTVETKPDLPAEEDFSKLGPFKEYSNQDYNFSFGYPEDWLVKNVNTESRQAGIVFDAVSTKQHELYLNGSTKIDSNLFISYWPNINNEYALGGNWEGRRQYTDLDDYITDPQFGYKKSLKTLTIDGKKVHIVTIGGQNESYGLMFESGGGIVELNFASTPDEKSAPLEVRKIVSTLELQ